MGQVANPRAVAARLHDTWSPRIVASFDDNFLKVAKLEGRFVWHAHDDEDELFFVLKGTLRIDMDDDHVVLHEGDTFVVPRGVRHCPVATDECLVMLIEKKSTLHTGREQTPFTRSVDEQHAPVVDEIEKAR